MIRSKARIFFATTASVAALGLAVPALAQEVHEHDMTPCAAPAAPPAEVAGWGDRHVRLTAAAKESQLKHARLVLGTAADATLLPTPSVKYVLDPVKPGGSVSYGGLFAFDAPAAGTYRVALSTGAWVDLVEGKTVPESTGHGPGPRCTGIRKMVDYTLAAGLHVVQISANGGAPLTLMVTKLP